METIYFKPAFKYPFNKASRLLNILWIFIPIIGWFALFGYGITIVKHFLENDFKELPKLRFGKNLKLGFLMFFKSIPFIFVLMIAYLIIGLIPFIGGLGNMFISIFVVPILTINFFKKRTVASYFEFEKLNAVFNNLGDYVIAVLKSIALQIIFVLLSIVLVGIPAGAFTKNIFIADFYRKNIE
ncbi:DUF4013 domain-containing protein [Candidatus Woesearchaeota archaeon]|nr:DUF4013 domain-containing protein [Candidatus Woesearchaeota archaeon]